MPHTLPEKEKILIICATALESELLIKEFSCMEAPPLLDFPLFVSRKNNIIIVQSGAGIANSSAATALAMSKYSPLMVYNTGICGIYSESPDKICLPVVGISSVFADTGKATDTGFLTTKQMGMPVSQSKDGSLLFNKIPLHSDKIPDYIERAIFFTVSSCSGSRKKADEYLSRFTFGTERIICEDMESAAVALICFKAGIPCTVLRVVSNLCGVRSINRQTADIAAKTAQRTLLEILKKN